jgi:hypothetical protein
MSIRMASLLFALTLPLAQQALADVAPPENYVEQCTLAKKTTSTSECLVCQAIREGYSYSDRCPLLLSPYCYVKVCGAWGGVSYPEVWCRTKGEGNPTIPDTVVSQLGGWGAVQAATAPANVTCLSYTPPPESPTNTGGSTGGSSAGGKGCNTLPGSPVSYGWVLLLGACAVAALLRRRASAIRCKKD